MQKYQQYERSSQYLLSKIGQYYRMFASENELDGPQDPKIERTIINFIKEFKEVKEDTKIQLNGMKEKELQENNRLSADQENTNIR